MKKIIFNNIALIIGAIIIGLAGLLNAYLQRLFTLSESETKLIQFGFYFFYAFIIVKIGIQLLLLKKIDIIEDEINFTKSLNKIKSKKTHNYLKNKFVYFTEIINDLKKGRDEFTINPKYLRTEIIHFVEDAEYSIWGISSAKEIYNQKIWWDIYYQSWRDLNIKQANKEKNPIEVKRLFIISEKDIKNDKFNELLNEMNIQSIKNIKISWLPEEVLNLSDNDKINATLLEAKYGKERNRLILLKSASSSNLNKVTIYWYKTKCDDYYDRFEKLFKLGITFDSNMTELSYQNIFDEMQSIKKMEDYYAYINNINQVKIDVNNV